MSTDLESRIRVLEDRTQISEQVIKYAVAVDRRDWKMFGDCFTDPVYTGYSEQGEPIGAVSRASIVAKVAAVLDGYTVTQHLSPNHIIEFDAQDPDRAICYAYCYAQHLLEGAEGGEFYLLRGSYTYHLRRTPEGWRIECSPLHVTWEEGNPKTLAGAAARARAAPAKS